MRNIEQLATMISDKKTVMMGKLLEQVQIKAMINDLFCDMEVRQTFNNSGETNIEAVYTFPIPNDAVLLDLTVKIGDRELQGTVLPKVAAARTYEKTLSDGDGAIMLEKADDGIYTINVGNLLPGESATLTYRYGYLLDWQHGIVKFRIPTTIAPRYGDPIAAGYQPHQVPKTDMLADNRYALSITVTGLLSRAEADCPSHRISVDHSVDPSQTKIGFQSSEAFMDRDFVLNFRLQSVEVTAGTIVPDSTSHGTIALASFCPNIPQLELPSACIKILVDCSGSMNGDSIAQAKSGLRRILDSLRETDTFNVIRFGDNATAYFPYCVPAKGRNLQNALAKISQLAADMGGTEMDAALSYTYGIEDNGDRPAMILLITDGEVSAHKEITRHAVRSGHRVFTVGVGSAVNEAFVRGIAEKTGGACELVSPNEGMADAIYRQFCRMLQQTITQTTIEWPIEPEWQSPKVLENMFNGDTKHVFASFTTPPAGKANLVLEIPGRERIVQQISLTNIDAIDSPLPRMAAAQRIQGIESDFPELAEKLALEYRLITQQTNYLIVEKREADRKAEDLPDLAQVKQMLAAGWGGTGSVIPRASGVRYSQNFDLDLVVSCSEINYSELDAPVVMRRARCESVYQPGQSLDIPSFLRRQADDFEDDGKPKSHATMMDRLADLARPTLKKSVASILKQEARWDEALEGDLLPMLPKAMRDQIEHLHHVDGWDKMRVYAAVLAALTQHFGLKPTNKLVIALVADFETAGLVQFFFSGIKSTGKNISWVSAFEIAPAAIQREI